MGRHNQHAKHDATNTLLVYCNPYNHSHQYALHHMCQLVFVASTRNPLRVQRVLAGTRSLLYAALRVCVCGDAFCSAVYVAGMQPRFNQQQEQEGRDVQHV